MATFTPVCFPVPEALRLASLGGIRTDLESVLAYCERLEQLTAEPFDSIAWEAFSSAAVVRYARCFGKGVRKPLEGSLVRAAPKELRDTHEYVLHLRSKHVAHSVNEFEENDVTLTISSDFTSSHEIQGVSTRGSRVMGLPFSAPRELKTLVEWLLVEIAREVEDERMKVLHVAHQFDLARLKSFGASRRSAETSIDKVHTRRRRP